MKWSVLYSLIGLTGMVFGAEIVASHITQSLVLLVSAYHMLYNILSLLLLVISYKMSKEKTLKNTFGWARVKVLGQLFNMLFLLALCFAAFVEAIQTMVHASHEDTEPRYPELMVFLGILNFIINIVCFALIGGYTHHQGCSMTVRPNDVQMSCVVINSTQGSTITTEHEPAPMKAYSTRQDKDRKCSDHQVLDIFRDISSGLTVIACGIIIILMDGLILKYADAILSMASVIVLLGTTYPFIRESGLILLQSIPSNIDVDGLTLRLTKEFPEVQNVHDLHIWRLASSVIIATVHIILRSSQAYAGIEARLSNFFDAEGISAVTIQPEFTNDSKFGCSDLQNSQCILQCSYNNRCDQFTCCGPLTEKAPTARYRGHSSPENGVTNNLTHMAMNAVSDSPILEKIDLMTILTATETTV